MPAAQPYLDLDWTPQGALALTGELDFSNAKHLRTVIDDGDTALVVDLSGLAFIDASGLSAFVYAATRRRVTITNTRHSVARVFRLGQIDHLLDAA